MWEAPARDPRRFQPRRPTPVLGWLFPLIYLIFSACASLALPVSPVLTGTFSGLTADGRAIRITFEQRAGTVIGRGVLAADAFEISALTAPQGPLILVFERGGVTRGEIALAPDGKTATIHGLGAPVTLRRGGEPISLAEGPFAGLYAAGMPAVVWLELQQTGELLAGTGYLQGRAVAVVAKISGPGEARGSALFSDGSRAGLVLMLSADGRQLRASAAAGIVEMERRR